MGDHLHIGFRLEEFIVRPVKNAVEGPNGSFHVSPRAMELLLALARKPGYVVSRNQLKGLVWGSEQISASVVTRCVGELRHVLGDNPESPRFIQTIPGRGYRLIPDPLALDIPVNDAGVGAPQSEAADNGSESLFGFFTDLARRKVYRIAASYLVAAWVILQVADVILDALPLPEYSMTFVVVALAMGFPVAVILAWAFQWTPQGLMVEGRGGSFFRETVQRALDRAADLCRGARGGRDDRAGRLEQVRVVGARDHQRVTGVDRVDVHEGDGVGVLVDAVARDLVLQDQAEHAGLAHRSVPGRGVMG